MQVEEIFIWGEKTKEKPANFAHISLGCKLVPVHY